MEIGSYDGPDPEGHALFLTRRYAGHRQLVETGRGAWFAAYLPDGRPVASLGCFAVGAGLARYQDVMTDADHRRRGIAAAGLRSRYAGRWARWPGRTCGHWSSSPTPRALPSASIAGPGSPSSPSSGRSTAASKPISTGSLA